MAKLIAVYEKCENLKLRKRQLPITVDDNKIMVMQLSDRCECCELLSPIVECPENYFADKEDSFIHQYNMLSREETLSALMVPAKTLFSRLAQVVGCVGCRRSVERLFYQLRDSENPAMEPLVVTASGLLTILMKISLQPKMLSCLFTDHRGMSEIFSAIPKLKKSGRCVLHSMEGVRCRPGSQAWLDMWEGMTSKCKDTITLISSDQLLTTLDNYLRKHRFCHECKNKVHRAYNILVGNLTIDPSKEKGYVASLYAGIRRCSKKHIHVSSETDYLMHLITRAEPELQGRRERHAKTLEIAQEEVLTCVGLFLYERLQRVQTKLREEEQTWEILFHVGLDALRRNFELAIEEKQGFSKFDIMCEELQRQEVIEKAKKEKKKKKKNNKKKVDEMKEHHSGEGDDEQSCEDCETNQASPISKKKLLSAQIPLNPPLDDEVSPNDDDELGPEWHVQGKSAGGGKMRNKVAPCHAAKDNSHTNVRDSSKSNASLDTFETYEHHPRPHTYHIGQTNNSLNNNIRQKSNGYLGSQNDLVTHQTSFSNRANVIDKHCENSFDFEDYDHQCLNGNSQNHMTGDNENHLTIEGIQNNVINGGIKNNNTGGNHKDHLTNGNHGNNTINPNFQEHLTNGHQHHATNASHQSHLNGVSSQHIPHECSISVDLLTSRCSLCSRDGGYSSGSPHCSACSNGSGGSSRDSSEVACGEGLCSHTDEAETHLARRQSERHNNSGHSIEQDSVCHSEDISSTCLGSYHSNHLGITDVEDDLCHEILDEKASTPSTMSLQQMLDDSSGGEADGIPEAEVREWHARQNVVKQKRAELRQKLKQRFQLLCHKKTMSDTVDNDGVLD